MRKLTANACFLLCIYLAACQEGYKQTESGLQYKIFEEGTGPVAQAGSTVKLHFTQLLHDTVTNTTVGKLPYYKALIPGTIFPYDPFEVLAKGVRAGDSIVVIQRMDSLLKKGKLQQLPAYLKPEDVLVVRIKVLRVFPFDIQKPQLTDSLIGADRAAEKLKMDSLQTILGPKRIEEYLQKKNIAAFRNDRDTYVQVLEPGTGAQADSGKTVLVKFKVSNLQGKVLDTNMDSSFRRAEPLRFTVGSGYMPGSVDASIRVLKKGGHAIIYIPAMVTIRDMPNGGEQSSYEDMVFEVIVEDVL